MEGERGVQDGAEVEKERGKGARARGQEGKG